MRVTDPLGFADGTWMLNVDESGRAEVSRRRPAGRRHAHRQRLSSIVLGGVAATTLRAAGIVVADESVTVALDAVFTSPQTPYLSLWY